MLRGLIRCNNNITALKNYKFVTKLIYIAKKQSRNQHIGKLFFSHKSDKIERY